MKRAYRRCISFYNAPVAIAIWTSGNLILSQPVPKQEKTFALPPKNDTMRRVFAYLCDTRGIDREVLHTFVRKGMIYESADFHNAVFVGFDKNGIARHVHKRGSHSQSSYKGNADSSNPAYSFHWNGGSGKLYLFEMPVDMLSYISMNKENWQQHSYAAACSGSDLVLFQCMKDMGNIDTVCLCLDNDEAGQSANRRISPKLREQGVECEILIPNLKDWNEDLVSDEVDLLSDCESEEMGERICQT